MRLRSSARASNAARYALKTSAPLEWPEDAVAGLVNACQDQQLAANAVNAGRQEHLERHPKFASGSRGVSGRSTSKFGSPLSIMVRQNVGIVGGETMRTLGPLVPTTVQNGAEIANHLLAFR